MAALPNLSLNPPMGTDLPEANLPEPPPSPAILEPPLSPSSAGPDSPSLLDSASPFDPHPPLLPPSELAPDPSPPPPPTLPPAPPAAPSSSEPSSSDPSPQSPLPLPKEEEEAIPHLPLPPLPSPLLPSETSPPVDAPSSSSFRSEGKSQPQEKGEGEGKIPPFLKLLPRAITFPSAMAFFSTSFSKFSFSIPKSSSSSSSSSSPSSPSSSGSPGPPPPSPSTEEEPSYVSLEDEGSLLPPDEPQQRPLFPSAARRPSLSHPPRPLRFRAPSTSFRPAPVRLSSKPRGFTYALFRWPLLLLISLFITLELLLYVILRTSVAAYERLYRRYMLFRDQQGQGLGQGRRRPQTYQEWKVIGEEVDRQGEREEWKGIDEFPFYDSALVAAVMESLAERISKGDYARLSRDLVEACRNNLAGIENEQLYSFTHVGTKHLVEEHLQTVCQALDHVARCPEEREGEIEGGRAELFRRLGKAYGRSALCLSAGASFGYYHLGVIRCLLEQGLLPKVISGTSAGALIAAFVCVRRDAELLALLHSDELFGRFQANDEGWKTVVRRFFSQGVMFDLIRWEHKLRKDITKGNTTFLEAYQQTGRILNISVAAEEKFSPPMLLNYKTSPHVVIWSAILASSAVPAVLPAVELQCKKPDGTLEPYRLVGRRWRDGILRADIPYTGLRQLFGVCYTIVSQVNPHVIPFFYRNRGSGGAPTLHRGGQGWRGGFLSSVLEDYLRLDLRKWVQLLHDFDLSPRVFGQDWSVVFLQNFTGNVTIVPEFSLADCIRVISDPNQRTMARYLQRGEMNTWPTVTMVANRLKVEQKLERLREMFPLEAGRMSRSSSQINLFNLD